MALTLGFSYITKAQVTAQKIGTNPTTIAPSAVLDIESTNKGVFFPRVALTAANLAGPIVSPATGLTVFNTATDGTAPNTVTPGYYYWNSSRWVKLAVETPPIAFAKTVYVNTALPSTATIFDETNPPATNNNDLKAKDDNLYIGNDGSTWTYDNTGAGSYKTYAVAPSTPFNLASSTTDAGNNKTANIWRDGSIGVGTNNPLTTLHVNNPLVATNTVNANAQVFRMQRSQNPTVKWENIAQFNLGSYAVTPNTNASSRLDLAMNDGNGVATSNIMTWQANGNVGIGTTAPSRFLDVINNSSTYNGIIEAEGPVSNTYTRAMAIRMRRGTSTAPTAIQTNDVSALGFAGCDGSTYSTAAAGISGLASENWTSTAKGMALTLSTSLNGTSNDIKERMRIDHNGNVGIGTIAPISQLSNAPTGTNFVSSNSAVQSATGISWLTNTTGFNTSLFNSNNVVGSNGLQVKIANTSNQTTAFEVGQNTSQTGVSNPLFNVLGNGNVGVGTNAPSAQLHTTGTLRFSGAGTPGVNRVLTSDANGNATWQNQGIGTAVVSNANANRTLTAADNGSIIVINSANPVTITVPTGLSTGFSCQIIQANVGQISLAGSAGVTLNSAFGLKARTQNSSIGVVVTGTNVAYISGDTAF